MALKVFQFYPKWMNRNPETFYFIGCCTYRGSLEIKSGEWL